jgi:hypothetical protein
MLDLAMTNEQPTPQKEFGNVLDFVYHAEGSGDFQLEISVMKDGKVCVFHNKPFKSEISWLEYDVDNNRLDFILDDGEVRNLGFGVKPTIAKNMQNSHQILLILLDPETGEAKEGFYIPLIIHQEEKS